MAVGLSSVGPEMNETWNECRHLLFDLKTTVEGLLANQTTNVWNTYGGLSRLTNVVNNVLCHRLKSYQGTFDYWNFLMGLRVLVPSIGPWLERFRLQTEGNADRSSVWIRQRLQEHTLSIHLNILVGDSRHLKSCYEDEAFLRQEVFCKSLLTCLRAVENNHLSTLAELDPSLLIERVQHVSSTLSSTPQYRHRRSPSLPTNLSDLSTDKRLRPGVSFCVDDHVRSSTSMTTTTTTTTTNLLRHSDPTTSRQHHRPSHHHSPLPPLGDLSPPSEALHPLAIPKSTTWNCGLANIDRGATLVKLEQSVPLRESRPHPDTQPRHERSKSDSVLLATTLCPRNARSKAGVRLWRSCSDTAGADPAGGNGNNLEPTKRALLEWWSNANQRPAVEISDVSFRLPMVDYGLECSLESSTSDEALIRRPDKTAAVLSPSPTVAVTAVHRSPSHVRSKSDVVGGAMLTAALVRPVVAAAAAPTSIPMSSSLPSDLNCRAGPSTDDDYYCTQLFRPPVQGQSLTSFLLQQDFRTCADLERENAHFNISEALIAAIEQIKCKQQMFRIAEEADRESDDDEIKHLKQRIRIRRRERLQEQKVPYRSPLLLSDGRTDTTSQSPSPRSTSSDNKSGNTSDSVDQIDLSDGSEAGSKLSTLNESSALSLSMASLYSDADILRPLAPPLSTATTTTTTSTVVAVAAAPERFDRSSAVAENLTTYVSAESVALNLLKRFSEKQLPKASDLDWLVSEQDAPQKLLPLPRSWPISPDDAENGQQQIQTQMRLRGNMEWAPPRPQVIFNIHPAPQRKVIMAKQNYRCAGCGTKVEPGYMRRFRYCEYLGKYFCQCCHNNGQAHIPAKILRKWDFSRCHVSNFSRDVLQQMCAEPLYDIADLNPGLYRRVKALNQVLQYRLQLFSIKDFVRVCRDGVSLAEELDRQPSHLIASPNLYSINDLISVKSGEMCSHLKSLVNQALLHIKQCQLCQARGFYCEFCKNNKEIIFPFQLGKVSQCSDCWSCYHSECYVPDKCPKCARIEARKIRLLQSDDTD